MQIRLLGAKGNPGVLSLDVRFATADSSALGDAIVGKGGIHAATASRQLLSLAD